MWQRFTERARRVIYHAQEEAQRFGNDVVGPEHILLGLCRDDSTVAATLILSFDTTFDELREQIEPHIEAKKGGKNVGMTLTPRAKRVIDLAYDEARNLNNNYIGTEHLVLGLVREGDSLAGRVLAKSGISLEKARKLAMALQDGDTSRVASLALTSKIPSGEKVLPLRVAYDLQLLHPVDQMLLALLTDMESDLGTALREKVPGLGVLIPSVIAVMNQANTENRRSLALTLIEAQVIASNDKRAVVGVEDLYLACVKSTTQEVRDTLGKLEIDPFS